MASYKKNAARLGAHLVFIDESGFLLTPPVRKTWGPKAHTPAVRHHFVRQRISVISALTLSPTLKRLGLFFALHEKNIRRDEICAFLRHLLKHLRKNVIVIWDNIPTHKGEPIRDLCRRFKRLHIEALPPYAPELNPDEGVWSQAKNTLANGRPDTLEDLSEHLLETLHTIKRSQRRLRACVRQSDLPPFLP